MLAAELLPESPGVRVVEIVADATSIVATVETTAPEAPCPVCGRRSSRVHGRYFRRLADRSLGRSAQVVGAEAVVNARPSAAACLASQRLRRSWNPAT
jgi:hypothetical protein